MKKFPEVMGKGPTLEECLGLLERIGFPIEYARPQEPIPQKESPPHLPPSLDPFFKEEAIPSQHYRKITIEIVQQKIAQFRRKNMNSKQIKKDKFYIDIC